MSPFPSRMQGHKRMNNLGPSLKKTGLISVSNAVIFQDESTHVVPCHVRDYLAALSTSCWLYLHVSDGTTECGGNTGYQAQHCICCCHQTADQRRVTAVPSARHNRCHGGLHFSVTDKASNLWRETSNQNSESHWYY